MKRRTWQRDAVAEALAENTGFVSAQALYGQLRDAGSPIGLATVYRTLAKLAEGGEIDSLQLDGEGLYRACATEHHHHHLICRSCGTTAEVEAEPVEAWARAVAAQHGFTAPAHVVDVFGMCPECSAEAAAGR